MRTTLLNTLALAGAATAQQAHMMRFACSQLTVERLDPLVNPGMVGTPHTHQIVGGNSFKPLMKPLEHDQVNLSTCTSCTFSEGMSGFPLRSLTRWTLLCRRYMLTTFRRLFKLLDRCPILPSAKRNIQESQAGREWRASSEWRDDGVLHPSLRRR